MRIYLNDDWSFKMDNKKEEIVRLPHTTIETPFNCFSEDVYQGISTYKKTITKKDEWKDKHILLTIEAAAHQSTLFINDREVMNYYSGYTAYSVEIEDYLTETDNEIKIVVDSREDLNLPPFGNVIDYMTYSGIYREVYIDVENDNYITDTFLKTRKVSKNEAIFELDVTKRKEEDDIEFEIFDDKNKKIEIEKISNKYKAKNIKLWTPNSPSLYTLITKLKRGNEVISEKIDRIGFRTTVFKKDGFYLNNEKFKIRGLNRHQSYPYIGYAAPKSLQEKDAIILKEELSLNAVRTSHYPQSHHFISKCDEIGLLVFTEIPGWQHIGDDNWKNIALDNTKEMVMQYRNHPSIFVWGVRINESIDDDDFYKKTNIIAHSLDDTRQTTGVRFIEQSSLLEDVYSFNDFSHTGDNNGTRKKKDVTSDTSKPYLITEYNGHMYPTKSFDNEERRTNHAIRHAKVIDSYYKEEDISGGFGWCFADYNTHKDFGSGDRICYHGVTDMFRNPKLAASIYSSQEIKEPILEITSDMNIGEHSASSIKEIYAITNADSVKLYKNGEFIKEYFKKDSKFKSIPNGPILIDDFVGNLIKEKEGYSQSKANDIKKILLAVQKHGLSNLPLSIKLLTLKCILFKGMKFSDGVTLFNKYIGNWGGNATYYTFEAIKDNKVIKTVIKGMSNDIKLKIDTTTTLTETSSYDMALVRIMAKDENDNTLTYVNDVVKLKTTGEVELVGPEALPLTGGMTGCFVKTSGKSGNGTLEINFRGKTEIIKFNVNKEEKL